MDPRAMEIAMEQMRRMTPDQMQSMMASMRGMDPSMMQAAMAQMKNMNASDWETAKRQMAGMDPEAMAQQARAASAQLGAQQQYVFNASKQLKDEGNQLIAAGRHEDAAAKYTRAKSNLEPLAAGSREAKDLMRACALNLSMCHLKLGRFSDCIQECSAVLKEDPSSLKALYRRGWAQLELSRPGDAASDLEAALRLAGSDAAQRQPIQEKLDAALAAASASTAAAAATEGSADGEGQAEEKAEEKAAAGARSDQKEKEEADGVIEDEPTEEIMTPAVAAERARAEREARERAERERRAAAAAAAAALPPPMPGMPGGEEMAKMVQMAAENPEMLRMAADMMASMPPEQFAAMAGAAPGMTPELARMAAQQVRGMSSDDLKRMAQSAAALSSANGGAGSGAAAPGGGVPPAAAAAAATAASSGGLSGLPASGLPAGLPTMDPSQMDPSMMQAAAEMVERMSAEDLKAMMAAAGAAQGIPVPDMDPEMLKASMAMMKNMSPQDLAQMQSMAAAMGGGAPGGGAAAGGGASAAAAAGPNPAAAFAAAAAAGAGAGPGGMPSQGDMMAQIAQNPAMIEASLKMLKTMDEESVIKMFMSQSGGGPESEAAIRKAVAAMRGMSDSQVAMVAKAASTLSSGAVRARAAKEWLASQPLLVAALVVLIVAVLLRWLGIM